MSLAFLFPLREARVPHSRLDSLLSATRKGRSPLLFFGYLLLALTQMYAATGGSITGTVADQSGAVIPNAALQLVNIAQQTKHHAKSDGAGLFTFPNLPVGHYDLTVTATGFTSQKKTGLVIDTDSALKVDFMMQVGGDAQSIQVTSEAEVQIDSVATHLGDVVTGAQMTALPLNGRAYTDLLAIQPGVTPISTLLPSSVIMAGVTGSIDPSGDQNAGNLSISGQRESSNGWMVNGIDVREHMNGGTAVVPDLDSIDEFRVLTNNFDPEYGNYNGGMVTVVSKVGTDQVHGSAYEFLRNTSLDSRGYFDPVRAVFRQNQFGGTVGGPIKHDKIFFFGDYQGTRTTQGVSTGNITVPSLAERSGDFSGEFAAANASASTPFVVSGPYIASVLTQALGAPVTPGELYTDVFPNGAIPAAAFSAPYQKLIGYVPQPNSGPDKFTTSAFNKLVTDNKFSVRADSNTRIGQVSGYYFFDQYSLDNPYPGNVAGASIPGFDAIFSGRAQLASLGITTTMGSNTVNEFHLGVLRDANIVGQPKGGLGVPLSAQGIAEGGNTGIYIQAPQYEGVMNITFPQFVMGVPITNVIQDNNTYYLSDGLTRVIGAHSLKFGVQYHMDQVNEHPNGTFNGTFNIEGTETGVPFADFLLGVTSNYTQSDGPPFYLRNHYLGAYGQDSWRARPSLTINLGVRWDIIEPWSEKYGSIQTYVAGRQSELYPNAIPGMVVPGDPGIPSTISPTKYSSVAPRISLAYSPNFDKGTRGRLLGGSGKMSIRASYGLFYTSFPGLDTGIMYAVPPFGYNYLSSQPPLLAQPFVNVSDGGVEPDPYPLALPPHGVSKSHPYSGFNWTAVTPISADPFFYYKNSVPYISNYMLSIQRQLRTGLLLTVSYVGNQGHHIMELMSVNPGNQALCLSLPGCGPFAEDGAFTTASGAAYQGTRSGQERRTSGVDVTNPPTLCSSYVNGCELYQENTEDASIGNSNYNTLQSTLRYQRGGSQASLSYSYAKSIDQGSNIGEQLDPLNPRHARAISAWDMKHSVVANYTWQMPVAWAAHRHSRLTEGWSLSGTARFTTGLPVTLFDNSDNSLLGTLGNGANNYLLDTPQQLPGSLHINRNGRNGKPAFNTAIFPEESLGQLGNARRREFYGPGIENFDTTLKKDLAITDRINMELRLETFNTLNHAQFYGPAAVDGQKNDAAFGDIESAAAPRLIQLAARFSF
jgi:hypothetical protein